jgi:prepilin-type N-terminal cleavage/methylation domain-containing protein
MATARPSSAGFTLVELMITVAVVVILALIALPSFSSFRQRSALRGAGDQVESFWSQARFEAAKRNQMVKVGVNTNGSNFCLGAATTTNRDDTTPCDCFTANACDVAGFPAPPVSNFDTQSEWRGVTFVVASGTTPTLGGADQSVAVIEPKRAGLASANPAGQAGALTFAAPRGAKSYKLNFVVDQFGRGTLCQSTASTDTMSDYINRKCSP